MQEKKKFSSSESEELVYAAKDNKMQFARSQRRGNKQISTLTQKKTYKSEYEKSDNEKAQVKQNKRK